MADPMTALIIDDEELVRRHLRLFVEHSGLTVLEAADGQTGLDMVDRQPPDLVLTDLRMPVVDGFKVIEHLTLRHPDIPIIVVSNTTDVQHALEAIRGGAWDISSSRSRTQGR